MRVFRRRKKNYLFDGAPEDAAPPIPDIVYQMGAEAAAKIVAAQSRPHSPYAAMNPMGYDISYNYPYAPMVSENDFIDDVPEMSMRRESRSSSPLNFISSARARHRSTSRGRPGSPQHFVHSRPGTPIKYLRRAGSPELMKPRVSSPYHFAQTGPIRPGSPYLMQNERMSSPLHFAQTRMDSPKIARRLQRAQLSQELQRMENEQRLQQEIMMNYPMQYSDMQSPYYPAMNINSYMPVYPVYSYY